MFKFNNKKSRDRFRKVETSISIVYFIYIVAIITLKFIPFGNMNPFYPGTGRKVILYLICDLSTLLLMIIIFCFLIYFLRKYYRFDYNLHKK